MNYTELNHHSSITVITFPTTCTTIVPWGSKFNSSMIGDSNHIRKLGYGPENTIWNPDDWIPRVWSESPLSPDDLKEQPGALWGNIFFLGEYLKVVFQPHLGLTHWLFLNHLCWLANVNRVELQRLHGWMQHFLLGRALLLIWSVFCGIIYEGVFRV